MYESEIERIREISDPLERSKAAGEAQVTVKAIEAEFSRIRREALEELIRSGVKQADIARQLGITTARMSQLVKSGPSPERAFFGATTAPVNVAVAEKRENKSVNPGPVVSSFDMRAYDKLRCLVEDLGLKSTFEEVKPPGNVRLNRDGLVLICGPRHSPLIAQVLESDDKLAFDKDDEGWHLVDREAGAVYRSLDGDDVGEDIAYFGRLPRPDGKGHFLYIAGIHAAGAAGVVHYLSTELASLYREVRMRRFSMLISCRYDSDTREIISSERITPIYRHEG
ncbi:hypothetical protein ACIBCT_39110 [Streptosporangium sp. NPDC050855]|uniref:hypothetical protein n=1 Tax=Streptosporangium sp. NPDC050855 TaxID=3366194 RepID=UPI0037B00008